MWSCCSKNVKYGSKRSLQNLPALVMKRSFADSLKISFGLRENTVIPQTCYVCWWSISIESMDEIRSVVPFSKFNFLMF